MSELVFVRSFLFTWYGTFGPVPTSAYKFVGACVMWQLKVIGVGGQPGHDEHH